MSRTQAISCTRSNSPRYSLYTREPLSEQSLEEASTDGFTAQLPSAAGSPKMAQCTMGLHCLRGCRGTRVRCVKAAAYPVSCKVPVLRVHKAPRSGDLVERKAKHPV